MAKTFSTGAGNKIKIYVGPLPLGDRLEPFAMTFVPEDNEFASDATELTGTLAYTTDAEFTADVDLENASPATTAYLKKSDASIAPASLPNEYAAGVKKFAIAGGTPITFSWKDGSATGPVKKFSTLIVGGSIDENGVGGVRENVVYDDVPLYITSGKFATIKLASPLPTIGTGSVLTSVIINPKVRLLGGTSTGLTVGADKTESLVFEDELGYSDGIITSQNWEIPWTANLLGDDLGYRSVLHCATEAISGKELYLWQHEPAPSGYTTGDTTKGTAVVTNFSKDFPSDGILTYNCTFSGQGSPMYTPVS